MRKAFAIALAATASAHAMHAWAAPPKVYGTDAGAWGSLSVFVPAEYPRRARDEGRTATVDIEGKLVPRGVIEDVRILSETPDAGDFVREVESVAPYWRFFVPYGDDCMPRPANIKLRVHFESEGKISVSHAKADFPNPPPARMPAKRVQPLFPIQGQRAGVEAVVYAAVRIEPDGKVGTIDTQVAAAVPGFRKDFERTTRAAIQQWVFPESPNGQPWIACMALEYKLR